MVWETPMSIESLTYAEMGDRLGTSADAARSLARRLRLPRKPGNDGKARVTIDLTEIQYKPLRTRSLGDGRAEIDGLNARVEQLQRANVPAFAQPASVRRRTRSNLTTTKPTRRRAGDIFLGCGQ
jgi:hypothetical protein